MRARNLLTSFGIFALLACGQALAIGEDEYLQPEEAFQYTASADEHNVTVEWRATKGYYLYKKSWVFRRRRPASRSVNRCIRRAKSTRTSSSASRKSFATRSRSRPR